MKADAPTSSVKKRRLQMEHEKDVRKETVQRLFDENTEDEEFVQVVEKEKGEDGLSLRCIYCCIQCFACIQQVSIVLRVLYIR